MLKSAAIPHFANATILPNKFCGGKLFSRNLRISYGNYTPVHVSQALCLSHGPGKHDQVIPWYFRSATFPLPPMPASSGLQANRHAGNSLPDRDLYRMKQSAVSAVPAAGGSFCSGCADAWSCCPGNWPVKSLRRYKILNKLRQTQYNRKNFRYCFLAA